MDYTPHEQLLLERIQDMDEHDLASGIVPIRDVVDILGSRWKVEMLWQPCLLPDAAMENNKKKKTI